MIGKWRTADEKYGERAFAGNGHAYTEDARVAELERVIGQLTVENLLLKTRSLGGGHNVCPPLKTVRLSGRSAGCVQQTLYRLEHQRTSEAITRHCGT